MKPPYAGLNFRQATPRPGLAAAVALALVWPLTAAAWYDVPVRATTKNISKLRDMGVDPADLAAYLRTAADVQDGDATWARDRAARMCSSCRWELRTGTKGRYIWVSLETEDNQVQLDSAEIPVSEKKRATPRGTFEK